MFFGHTNVTFRCNGHISLQSRAHYRLRRDGNDVVSSLIGSLEIAQSHVSEAKVNQDVRVFRIERSGSFQISNGFSPLALTPLNQADCHVGSGFVWQTALGYLKFNEGALVIAVAIIIIESQREMAFGEIGLQSQGLIRVESRLLAPGRHRLRTVVQITLVPGKTGVSQCEVWIEFNGLFEKRLGLQR